MSKSHNRTGRPAPVKTLEAVDWSKLRVGTRYLFVIGQDFDDFRVMKNRAHNAARRRNLKASTSSDMKRGVLYVTFNKPIAV